MSVFGGAFVTNLLLFGIFFKGGAAQSPAVAQMLAKVNCSESTSVQTTNQQCLDMYNVAIVIENPDNLFGANPVQTLNVINNYLVSGSDVICSNQDDFTKAAICLLWVNRICYSGTVVLEFPTEADYLEDLKENCESIADLKTKANHGTDIETESSCKLGTDSSALLGILQQCMERNGVNIQLPDIVAASSDPLTLVSVMRNSLRVDTELLCSDVGPLTKATECINFLMYKCGSGALFLSLLNPAQDPATSYTETCDAIERLTSVPAEVQSLTATLDCTVQDDVISAQQQCFTLYDVNVEVKRPEVLAAGTDSSVYEIATLLVQNPDALCGSQFLNTSQCLYHTIFICDTDRKIDMLIFIMGDVALQYDQMCTFLTHESVECFKEINGDMMKCATDEKTCRDEQRQRACEYPIVKTCGMEAVSLFESQIKSVCRNDPDSAVSLLDGRMHRMDCSTPKGIQDGYLDCFIYHGIDFPGPDDHSHSLEFIIDGITEEFIDDLCSKLGLYQEAVSCVLKVATKCPASSEHALLPDSSTVNQGLSNLCQKRDEFDNDCVKNADEASCMDGQDNEEGHGSCSALLTQHRCKLDAIQSCNKATRDIYSEILEWQLPTSCQAENHVTSPSTKENGAHCPSVPLSVLVLIFGVYLF